MPVNNLIQLRRGSDWSANPVLSSGEPGFDIDKNILKVGDGSTAWSSLEPVNTALTNFNIYGTGNINISGNITANTGNLDVLSFNINNESILTKGQLSWDDTEGTLDIGLTDNTSIHIGEHRFFRIRNQTGGILYKGQVVYATGVHENGLISPSKYVADGTVREVRFMGVVLENVNDNNNGYVIDFGHLENMDLDGSATNYAVGDETWSAGDILYVHPTVAGKLTKVEPKHSITVAIILDPGSGNGNGRMFVRPTSYGHLDDNHDVAVSGATNGQFLQYNSVTDYWVPSSSGNFTTLQVNGTLVPTGVGTSNYVTKWTGTNSIGNSVVYDNGTNVGIGTASPSNKLTVLGAASFGTLERTPNNADAAGFYDRVEAGGGTQTTKSYGSIWLYNSSNVQTHWLHSYPGTENYINNGGNFGIGTSTPSARLNVEGGNVIFNDLGGNYDFRVEGDTDTNLLFTDASTDRVGIGTASPSYKLDVVGTGHFDALNINGAFTFPTSDGSADQYLKTDGAGNVSWASVNGGGGGVTINNYADNRVLTSDGTSTGINAETKLVFIPDPSGNKLGIGTTNPNGSLSMSNGSFGVDGDSQHTFLTARIATTNNVTATLFLDGSSTKIVLPPKCVWNFCIKLNCYSDTNDGAASWNFRGCIKRSDSTTSIVGSIIEENFIDSNLDGVIATIVADTDTNSLDINVNGLDSNDIRWTASLDITQTRYDTNNYVYFLPMMYDMVP